MPRKTDGEKIDELEKTVAALVERVDNVREAMIDKERLAVIEERLNELKKGIEEAGRRQWAIVPPIVGGLVGAILALLIQLALSYIRK
jgi:spore coat protein CotH